MSKKAGKNAHRRGVRTHMRQRRIGIENELFETMLRFVRACGAYDRFMKLPPREHLFLRKFQFTSVRIKAEKGSGIGDPVVNAVKKDLANYLRSKKVTLEGSDEEFTMYDLATAGQTLWQTARFTTEEKRWEDVLERLGPLRRYFDESDESLLINIIFEFLQGISDRVSSIDGYFIWFTWKLRYIGHHFATVYTMHRQSCERKTAILDDKPRPVLRVGYAVQIEGIRWAAVKGEKLLQYYKVDPECMYPVFIQSHALERIRKRLNPMPAYDWQIWLSFERAEISRGPAGNLFFAVRRADCKLGYLLTDFTGGELIVRSFLFITNTGTNEGRRFNERLRVETYSKKYFKLDSLFTYLSTDICVDPFFRSVLIDCGCEGLVRFKDLLPKIEIDDAFSVNLRRELALEDAAGKPDGTGVLEPLQQAFGRAESYK